MKKTRLLIYLASLMALLISLPILAQDLDLKKYAGKKILFIDSYHQGYEWSDGEIKGAEDVLKDKGVELKIHRMDTKKNPEEEFKIQAGQKVIPIIETFKPDVVIAADDNSSKYVVMPFYKNKDLPFVFCGLNWDASIYGFPYKNVTGMIEVSLIPQLIEYLGKYSKGKAIGYIAPYNETEKKEGEYYKKLYNITIKEIYLNNYEEWKEAFQKIQNEVDMLIVGNNAGIKNWNDVDAKKFIESNTKIPTGCVYEWMINYSLIGFSKVAEEQGEWAAQTALKILDGTPPSSIPIAKNKKGNFMVNMRIANKLGIVFDLTTLKYAKVIQ